MSLAVDAQVDILDDSGAVLVAIKDARFASKICAVSARQAIGNVIRIFVRAVAFRRFSILSTKARCILKASAKTIAYNRIQLGIPKRIIMGVSEVHGWGLYAGETITKSEFISEYKGELISVAEGNRRGSVYHTLGREYLFKLSKDQELAGSRVSNKAHFINNSSLAKNINVLPRLLLCNDVSRIVLYAARDIAAGEELFYDYGYHKEKRANFKEKRDAAQKPTLNSKATSQSAASVAPSTAPSVRSEPEVHFPDDSLEELKDELEDEPDDKPVLPTSEPDSEFDISNR